MNCFETSYTPEKHDTPVHSIITDLTDNRHTTRLTQSWRQRTTNNLDKTTENEHTDNDTTRNNNVESKFGNYAIDSVYVYSVEGLTSNVEPRTDTPLSDVMNHNDSNNTSSSSRADKKAREQTSDTRITKPSSTYKSTDTSKPRETLTEGSASYSYEHHRQLSSTSVAAADTPSQGSQEHYATELNTLQANCDVSEPAPSPMGAKNTTVLRGSIFPQALSSEYSSKSLA